jgi:anti-sigma regulatory factor (Ser/Thr protein kinase)
LDEQPEQVLRPSLLTPEQGQQKIPAAVLRAGRAPAMVPHSMSPSDLSFTLTNKRSEIARMFTLLEGFCQTNRISEDDMFNVRLVMDEAVINVMVHGYDDSDEHAIHVALSLDAGNLAIHIDDDGVEYNPLDAPAPRFDLPIEQRRIGGLGVHIMKTLAKSVDYRREAGRNKLDIQMAIGLDGHASSA